MILKDELSRVVQSAIAILNDGERRERIELLSETCRISCDLPRYRLTSPISECQDALVAIGSKALYPFASERRNTH
jgi:hypothetical protein